MDDQLELFSNGPFTFRWKVPDGLDFFWEHHWKHTAKARTTKRAFVWLKAFFSVFYVCGVANADILAMRQDLREMGYKENTINTYQTIMIVFYNKCYEWKEMGTFKGMNFAPIPLPRKNPAIGGKVDERQFRRKVAWPKKLIHHLINTALVLNDLDMAERIEVLYETKLRPGDVWRITDRNVDLPRRILAGVQHKTITRRLPSGVPYLLAIGERVASILKRRMEITPPGKPLFREDSISYEAHQQEVWKRFNIVRKAAGCPHVKLKDLRPSCATLELDNGIDPETVADRLGHTTLRMLPSYTPRSIVHQRKAQKVIEDKKTEIIY